MSLNVRLAALSAEIAEAQVQLRIVAEQLAFQSEVADDARIRALVSETPLADRESQIAADDLRRLQRSHDEAQRHVSDLRAEQDTLLERMLTEVQDERR
ncbi:MAG: hypothetical protein ACRDKS_03935 [Actinomycetota bacterium]